jgi:tRNA C32,U32 (ribose-2'-O)-methylase TrmJ
VVTFSSNQKVEEHTVSVLLRKPELLYRLDRSLQEYGLAPLSTQDFEYTGYQLLFDIVHQAVEQDHDEQHQFVLSAAPDSLQTLLQELLKKGDFLDPVDDKLLEELLRGIIKLRRVMTNENLNQLRFIQEEAHQSGDLRVASVQEMVLQNTRLLHDLDQATRKLSMKRLE